MESPLYVLVQRQFLRYVDINGTKLYFVLDAAGQPIEVTYCPSGGTNAFYYYVTNIQGDVTAILDSSGAAVVQYTYNAWGSILSISGSMASTLGVQNPFRYRGYVYDQETGLYYLQSRYYNPQWGRFLNADGYTSTGGLLGNNMFAYCGNNPVCYTDNSGTRRVAVGSELYAGSSDSIFVTYTDNKLQSNELLAKVIDDCSNLSPNGKVYIDVQYLGIYTKKLIGLLLL